MKYYQINEFPNGSTICLHCHSMQKYDVALKVAEHLFVYCHNNSLILRYINDCYIAKNDLYYIVS